MGTGLSLAAAVALPVAGGVAGAIFTRKSVKTWYKTLKKPSWTPPNWLFGPVWTALYISMGVASWLVHKQGGFAAQALPLGLYSLNLVLNFAWSPIFFGAKKLGLALLDILMLDAAVVATGLMFYQINPIAGMLFLPYLAWASYATCLNYNIYMNNGSDTSKKA